ncbi:hypothetical protein LXL04_010051 [Taraxacum kok-saghyz]
MEATVSPSLRLTTWTNSENTVPKLTNSMRLYTRFEKKKNINMLKCNHLGTIKPAIGHRSAWLKASCTSQNSPASVLKSETSITEEDLLLKKKCEEIKPCLSGICIYLVGMIGSGKTTICQILSEVLDYSFFDSDKLIGQAARGIAVADIFKLYGEGYFRDNETKVLHKLSLMHGLVISTGGGAVVRPINWKYMHKGITVFIDVPLDTLAQRLTACPVQPGIMECGYYVLKFMKAIVDEGLEVLTNNFWAKVTYTDAELDIVREEWCSYVTNFVY